MEDTNQNATAPDQDPEKQKDVECSETAGTTTNNVIISKERIKAFFSNTFVIGVLVAICVYIIGIGFRKLASESGEKLTAPFSQITEYQTNIDSLSAALLPSERKKVGSLNQIINEHKVHHKTAFLMMYRFHYANITFLAFFSILTAAMVFLIGQEGWKNSKELTKRLFIVFAAYTAFYGVSINIYQQKENIQNNLNAYLNYDNLQKEVYTFCLAEPYVTDTVTIEFNDFFITASLELQKLNKVYMQFDETAISSAKIQLPGNEGN